MSCILSPCFYMHIAMTVDLAGCGTPSSWQELAGSSDTFLPSDLWKSETLGGDIKAWEQFGWVLELSVSQGTWRHRLKLIHSRGTHSRTLWNQPKWITRSPKNELHGSYSLHKRNLFLPLKFFDDFKLKTASKHPFLKQAIHFIFLNFFLESNHRIF
jgi:hypothetical protein